MAAFSVLAAVALPSTVVGQSVATEMLLAHFRAAGVEHEVVDISREFDPERRWWTPLRRAVQVAAFPVEAIRGARRLRRRPLILYLQLGQSHRAMLRDLPLLALGSRLGWRRVLHVHGERFRHALDTAPRALRASAAGAVRDADRVVVLSESLRGMFDGLIDAARIAVIGNGVEEALALRARLHVREPRLASCLNVLYLSNLIEAKGYVTVLQAARLAAGRGLPHLFVLAGARTEMMTVDPERFVREHGLDRVRYAGLALGEDKIALLEQADVLVLPTRNEGQPIAVLEAMHFGLPVVVSRAGGIPDIVAEEQGGLYVPPDDPEALLAAIERLARDPGLRARLGAHNRARAALHTARAHGDAVVRLLAEVAGERPRC